MFLLTSNALESARLHLVEIENVAAAELAEDNMAAEIEYVEAIIVVEEDAVAEADEAVVIENDVELPGDNMPEGAGGQAEEDLSTLLRKSVNVYMAQFAAKFEAFETTGYIQKRILGRHKKIGTAQSKRRVHHQRPQIGKKQKTPVYFDTMAVVQLMHAFAAQYKTNKNSVIEGTIQNCKKRHELVHPPFPQKEACYKNQLLGQRIKNLTH